MFLQGKVNSARYIGLVINPVILSFLQQEGVTRTMHVHIQLLRCNVLFVMYNCPGQQVPQISCQLNTYGTYRSGNLLFSATTITELRQQVHDAWDNLSQDDIRHLYDHLHARIHVPIAAREGSTVH